MSFFERCRPVGLASLNCNGRLKLRLARLLFVFVAGCKVAGKGKLVRDEQHVKESAREICLSLPDFDKSKVSDWRRPYQSQSAGIARCIELLQDCCQGKQ